LVVTGVAKKEGVMATRWDVGNASMVDAQRIVKLAMSQGGYYVDQLWALVEYALDENVRKFAYSQASQSNRA
jgi:hypothetical protein